MGKRIDNGEDEIGQKERGREENHGWTGQGEYIAVARYEKTKGKMPKLIRKERKTKIEKQIT